MVTSATPYLLQQSTASLSLMLPPGCAIAATPALQAISTLSFQLKGKKASEARTEPLTSAAAFSSAISVLLTLHEQQVWQRQRQKHTQHPQSATGPAPWGRFLPDRCNSSSWKDSDLLKTMLCDEQRAQHIRHSPSQAAPYPSHPLPSCLQCPRTHLLGCPLPMPSSRPSLATVMALLFTCFTQRQANLRSSSCCGVG